jgi:hypothetical protein
MQAEQRLVDTLIKHWRRRKGTRVLPMIETFAPETLEESVRQNCCIFSVKKAAERWIYMNDYMGENTQKAVGRDMTGEVLTMNKSQFQAARVLEKAEDVLRMAEPLTDDGHFVNETSQIVKFRSCLLPFGRDTTVTHLLLGLSWRTF